MNEIQLAASLANTRAGSTLSFAASVNISQSGTQNFVNTQNVGLVTEPIALGDVTGAGLGYIYAKNLDTGNYVMLSLNNPVTSGAAFATLQPNEALVLPIRVTGFFGLANTAPCDVQFMALAR